MQYTEVHTVQEFIDYCRLILSQHPERMGDEEQKIPAGALTMLIGNDEYHKGWQEYPQIIEILDIASDLDWLNTYGAEDDWNRIRRLVSELEFQTKEEPRHK